MSEQTLRLMLASDEAEGERVRRRLKSAMMWGSMVEEAVLDTMELINLQPAVDNGVELWDAWEGNV